MWFELIKRKKNKSENICFFSLVELLVVLSMIIFLVSLLIPALNYAKTVTLRTGCKNNLSQNAKIMHSYASDHNGWGMGNVGLMFAQNTNRYIYIGWEYYNGNDQYTGLGKYYDLGYIDTVEGFYCPERDWEEKLPLAGNSQTVSGDYSVWYELPTFGRHNYNNPTKHPLAKKLFKMDSGQNVLMDYLSRSHGRNDPPNHAGDYYNGLTIDGAVRGYIDDDQSIDSLSNSTHHALTWSWAGVTDWNGQFTSFKKIFNEVVTGEDCYE